MKPSSHEMSEPEEEDLDDYSDDLLAPAVLGFPQEQSLQPALSETITPLSAGAGQRLDRYLSSRYCRTSRASLQRWIADGHVTINAHAAKSSYTLKSGDVIHVTPPAPVALNAWSAQPMALDIVHEDADVMVINKPAGLVVHPAAGHADGTLVNGLIAHHPAIISVARAGIVHRLDKDTSGLMVVAKTSAAQFSLVQQLQARSVKREYLALAWGALASQRIETLMGRDAKHRQRMAVLPEALGDRRGKDAITDVKQLARSMLFGLEVSLVRCALQTGRTHQIRVHLEHVKHPIVGDRTYCRHAPSSSRLGDAKANIESLMAGQALHAQRLSFTHPILGKVLSFVAQPPSSFRELLKLACIAESVWA